MPESRSILSGTLEKKRGVPGARGRGGESGANTNRGTGFSQKDQTKGRDRSDLK